MSLTKREPALLIGSITAVVTAVVAVVVAFGVDLTDAQVKALIGPTGLIVALIPLIQAVVTRGAVVSPATADARVEAAVQAAEPEVEPRRALIEG